MKIDTSPIKVHLTTCWRPEVFAEEIKVFHACLSALGYEVTYIDNAFIPDAVNIVFGAITIPVDEIRANASRVIIRNLEHVTPDGACMFPRYLEVLRNFPVWDYGLNNRRRLADAGVPITDYVPVCHSPVLETILSAPIQDIDVYFYGNLSPRRIRVLDEIRARGLNVVISNLSENQLFGTERDAMIARAKVVLNLGMHNNQNRVFENVRVSYLLANAKAVVGEVDETTDIEDDIRSAVVCGTIDELPDLCEALVKDDVRRRQIELLGQAIFRQRDGIHLIGDAMQRYLSNALVATPLHPPRKMKLESSWMEGWRYDFLNTHSNPHTRADIHLTIDQPLPFGTKINTWRWGELTLTHGMVDYILAEHVFERVNDIMMALTNCLNLLSEGGTLELFVPYDLGFAAWRDIRTRRTFNEQSFTFSRTQCIEFGWRETYFESVGLAYYFGERGDQLIQQYAEEPSILPTKTRCYEAMRITLIKRKMQWDSQDSFEYDAYFNDSEI